MDVVLVLIVLIGLLFDYTNGFHDASSVVSTVIATKALRPIVAISMAALLNFLGATHTSAIAKTLTEGLISKQAILPSVILASVSGAIFWNLFTWWFGMPSSSSYALVGGLVGAAIYSEGFDVLLWGGLIGKVILPMIISPIIGFVLAYGAMRKLRKSRWVDPKKEKTVQRMQVISASILALSHGLNDAQKSMAIITLGLFSLQLIPTFEIPFWVILSCALVMGLGTATGGFRIIRTVGFEMAPLRPLQGMNAELCSSIVILFASFLGMPISSTHMIVGSVAGVGAGYKRGELHWPVIKNVALAWIFTLPGAGLAAIVFLLIIEKIFS